jgi:hypothetical protein
MSLALTTTYENSIYRGVSEYFLRHSPLPHGRRQKNPTRASSLKS